MLYEAAYPCLWLMARAKHLHARTMVVLGRKPTAVLAADASPETHFRVISWKIRKFEIERLAALLPGRAAALALERFEVTRRPKQRRAAMEARARMRLCFSTYGRRRVDIRSMGPIDGPKVLLLHGWNADGAGLAALSEPLVRGGYQVFIPDLPGHGTSEGTRYAFQQLGQAVALCCNPYGPFEAVIGHSAGGLVAGLALQNGLKASRLVTLCSPSSLDDLLNTYLLTNQLPVLLLNPMRRRYQRAFGVSPVDVGPAMFAKLDVPVLAGQDESDWMIARRNATDIAEAANGDVFFTRGYSHLTILRSPELHERLHTFLASGDVSKGSADVERY